MKKHIHSYIMKATPILLLVLITNLTKAQTVVSLGCLTQADAISGNDGFIGLDRKMFNGDHSEGYMLNFDLPQDNFGPCKKISKVTISTTILDNMENFPSGCSLFAYFENIYFSDTSLPFAENTVSTSLEYSADNSLDVSSFDGDREITCQQVMNGIGMDIVFGGQLGYDLIPALNQSNCSNAETIVSDGSVTIDFEICVEVEIDDQASSANVNLSAINNPICVGDNIELLETDPNNEEWEWSGPNGFSLLGTNNNPIIPTSSSADFGDFMVTVTDSNGCTATDEITINESPQPTADAGQDDMVCAGESIVLTATGGQFYAWDTGDNTASTTVNPTSTTTYTVTVTDGIGCSASDEVEIIVISNTTADAGLDAEICMGETATLMASGGISYMWSTGDNSADINVSPPSTETFTVTVTDSNGCTATDEAEVIVNINTTAEAGPNEAICIGESITLTASGGVSYIWDTGDNNASTTVSPVTITTYIVTVTDSNGCIATDEVEISININTSANAGNNQEICLNESATLTASGGDSYEWDTGEDDQTIEVFPTVTTIYMVTVTDGNGCTDVADVEVAVEFAPSINISTNLFEICPGDNLILEELLQEGDSYEWTLPDGSISNGPILDIPNTTTNNLGDYILVVSTNNGCSSTDEIEIDEGDCDCEITAANLGGLLCNNNNTLSDSSDDFIEFTLDPAVVNGVATYTVLVSSGSVTPNAGAYGAPTTFVLQQGSAGNGNVTISLVDNNDPSCDFNVSLQDPGSCSTACMITTASLSSVSCDDGGTPSDDTDDFILFVIDPQATNGGVGYTVTSSSSAISPNSANYGSALTFALAPGTAGNGDVTVTITDDSDASCFIDITLSDPGSCSGTCNITTPMLDNVQCNDGGTPADATDDFISFTLSPNGTNISAQYNLSAGAVTISPSTGTFGVPNTFMLPAGSAGGGDVQLTLTDVNNPSCTIDVLVVDPGSCSGACTIMSAPVINITCDDNGTLMEDTDDVISFSLNPVGSNLGANYIITTGTGAAMPSMGTYGTMTTFMLQAGSAGAGDVTVTITDSVDPNCSIDVIVSDPGTCSDCATPPVVSLILPQTGICTGDLPIQLGGNTPSGGVFSGTGVVGDTFDPTGLPPGLYPITYTINENGCTAQDDDVITIFALPTVTLDPPMVTVCTPSFTLNGGLPMGGSYSGDGVFGDTFDATTAGLGTHIVTYSFTAVVSGCTDMVTQTIEVVEEQQCDDGDCTNGIENWDTATCSCVTTPTILGCTNPTATNFDPTATCDDGSCNFACPDPGTCDDGDCSNGEEIWDGNICDCVATNIPDPNTCINDGDCTNGVEIWNMTTCICEVIPQVLGCTDPNANNFNPNATCDDGSCDLSCPDPGNCDDGVCTNGTEIWNSTTCMCESINPPDPTSCIDDGDCTNGMEVWNDANCMCESINPPDPSTCVDDGDCTNGTEVWDDTTCTCESLPEVVGCTEPGALNYNPNATCDDGSCMYDCPALMLNIGDPCDDQNPDTENDTIDANCDCNGTANCGIQTLEEQPCDDGEPCTFDDVELVLSDGTICEPCLGTPVDCDMTTEVTIQPCDDGNAFTLNDMETVLVCDGSICIPCQGVAPQTRVFLPTAIQSDDRNQLFGPYSGTPVLIAVFTIYDRWGEAVHHVENISTDDPAVFWDGRFNGSEVEQGVYVYRLVYMEGDQEISEVGDITVIR